MTRRQAVTTTAAFLATSLLLTGGGLHHGQPLFVPGANAWMMPTPTNPTARKTTTMAATTPSLTTAAVQAEGTANVVSSSATRSNLVAYKPLTVRVDVESNVADSSSFVQVPVACWFPASTSSSSSTSDQTVTYEHSISVKRIGELLAKWTFIPTFVNRSFQLQPGKPTSSSSSYTVCNGSSLSLPSKAPVVFLAHGFLGSRYDLSHLAEALAAQGFVCVAPEYPGSLAASYDMMDGLTRDEVQEAVLRDLSAVHNCQGTAFGIVGHSMGCNTVGRTGDETWARVCLAGLPRQPDGLPYRNNVLLIWSLQDGTVRFNTFAGGMDALLAGYERIQEETLLQKERQRLPRRAAWILQDDKAPNHISFMASNANDAMIDFLSPLLPVAKAFDIPVLDFDRYQTSRDSNAVAQRIHPIIIQYLKQEMNVE